MYRGHKTFTLKFKKALKTSENEKEAQLLLK